MKTTVVDIVNILNRIDLIAKDLYNMSVDPTFKEHESDTLTEAIDLIGDYKDMILRTKVEI